ncbi:MAG TPA: bifunctional diguanylate cyclase/phosphodiesterase [Microthrixaceae bacterium]|nr:bifunctional diguanylate cyclase/phosphodiesterase [Microthrixaceae bacterium]
MSLRTPLPAPHPEPSRPEPEPEDRSRAPAPEEPLLALSVRRMRPPRRGLILRGPGQVPPPVAPGVAFERAPWPSLVVDLEGSVLAVNADATHRLGALVGSRIESLFTSDPAELRLMCTRAVAASVHGTTLVTTPSGWRGRLHLFPLALGAHAVAMVWPVDADPARGGAPPPARVDDDRRDPLTGLGDRRDMLDAIGRVVRDMRQGRLDAASVVHLDLDDFNLVNDSLGHEAGDQLLATVAERLVRNVRAGVDVVTRLGGDEFAVLLPGASVDGRAAEAADRLVEAIAAPYLIDGHTTVVTTSVGLVGVDGSRSAEEVLRDADVAVYQAKRAGKGRAVQFSPEARDAAKSHLAVLTALRGALECHPERFHVVYQPICALDGSVVALEALARWTDPELGAVAPSRFITAAEGSGLADRIGELVRGIAIRDVAAWRAAGWDGYVSVNVSAEELASERLVCALTSQLAQAGVPGTALCAEVTETSVMADPEAARRILDDLASHGIRIAIDDFGTGHSSLAYLKRFPVSVLKLAREFVDGVEVDGEDRAICAAIVALAASLGLQVTAEGVETDEQLAALASLGVDAAQGWWFSSPVRSEDIPALLGIGDPVA